MTGADSGNKPRQPWAGDSLRGAPRRLVLTMLAVEAAAAGLCLFALVSVRPTERIVVHFLVLALLCIVFEEITRKIAKLRLLISAGPQQDMTSVWTFAGALVLPAGYAGLLAVLVAGDLWLREHRATGQLPYRRIYAAATVVLASVLAGAIVGKLSDLRTALPVGLYAAMVVVLALLVYTAINRVLVAYAAVLIGIRGVSLLGAWEDNSLELATLCLGAATAILLHFEPWLSFLALLPMFLLQRGALITKLENLAYTDAKTGLLNVAAWREAADRELVRLAHESQSATLLIIDLDQFKLVNDEHGHLVGDAALGAVGDRLRGVLRQHDVAARFGGEEFVVLLPRLGRQNALALAERVRASVASIALSAFIAVDTDGSPCAHMLTASIGVAILGEHGDDLDDLLRAADLALYTAKRLGRDRVAMAQDGSTDDEPLILVD